MKTRTSKTIRIAAALFALTLLCLTFSACGDGGNNEPKVNLPVELSAMQQFESVEQLKQFVCGYSDEYYPIYIGNGIMLKEYSRAEISMDYATSPSAGSDNTGGAAAGDHSETNTQVEGVDEGDVIKADGNYVYKLSTNGFVIVSVNGGSMSVAADVRFENYVPKEMYLYQNKLVVIGGVYERRTYTGSYGYVSGICFYNWLSYTKTDVRVYDISDRTAPVLERQVTVGGQFDTSRIVGTKLYYFTNYYFGYNVRGDDVLPKISDSVSGGEEHEMDVANVYYYGLLPSYSYQMVGCIDLSNPVEGSISAFLGVGGEIYVSGENAYIATTDYNCKQISKFSGEDGTVNDTSFSASGTRIVKISLNTLKCTAKATVEGYINDRYSLDEYDGNLRVATTVEWRGKIGGTYKSGSYSTVYVLGGDLATLGSILNIAEGEKIYSVRFNGTKGVLVTFKQIDPLFELDLSDPTAPTISTGLKEEGVSTYLHYIEGTSYVIGLGRSTKDNGYGGVTYDGIKISLYDMSIADEQQRNVSTVILGESGSCAEALYNPKAILYDKEHNLFAFAAEIWSTEANANGITRSTQSAQGLYVFGWEGGTLTQRAMLTELPQFDYSDWYAWYDNHYSFIQRGVRIGDYVYTVSDSYVTAYSMQNFEKAGTLKIAEFQSANELFDVLRVSVE